MPQKKLPANQLDVGTGPNQIVQLDGSGSLPPVDGSMKFTFLSATKALTSNTGVQTADLTTGIFGNPVHPVPANAIGIFSMRISTLDPPGTSDFVQVNVKRAAADPQECYVGVARDSSNSVVIGAFVMQVSNTSTISVEIFNNGGFNGQPQLHIHGYFI